MVKKTKVIGDEPGSKEPWSIRLTTFLFVLSGLFFCILLIVLVVAISNRAVHQHAYAMQMQHTEHQKDAPTEEKPTQTPVPTPAPKPDCAVLICLALTFDDGPSTTTEPMLDILKVHDAKATFFLLGIQTERYPDTARRIQREGHTIGNHTYGHRDLMRISLEEARWEVTHTSNIIESVTGHRPTIARAPYGSMSDQRAEEVGLPFIKWTIDSKDWEIKDAGHICQGVLAAASRNAIILSHDIYQPTLEGYACAIPELKKRGFSLVGVQDLP